MSICITCRLITLNFSFYDFRKNGPNFMPVSGHLTLKLYDDWFRERDEIDGISMQFDPIDIKLDNGKTYCLMSLSVRLDESRLIRHWDTNSYEWINLGEMPEFKTPEEALDILEKFLKEKSV